MHFAFWLMPTRITHNEGYGSVRGVDHGRCPLTFEHMLARAFVAKLFKSMQGVDPLGTSRKQSPTFSF